MADLMRCTVGQVAPIDLLPDDVLLSIFDSCVVVSGPPTKKWIEAWQSLVHVCRRWRSVVFGSPCRLNLRLVFTAKKLVRDMDVWPPLPLIIQDRANRLIEGVDNIIGALERRDRVDRIELFAVNSSPLGFFLAAMQEPFPELTHLLLESYDETVSVLPDSFLGQSAPRLVYLTLLGIPFPGLPKLLLSPTHLVNLRLFNIPHSGYISPNAIVTTLSTLTGLQSLILEFQSPRSRPDPASRHPPPLTRSVLPVLIDVSFKGVCEYLDDLVARVDAPQLNRLFITFFNDIVFDAPQFTQFICRTPTLEAFENAHVVFGDRMARVSFFSQTSRDRSFKVRISCGALDWQASSLEQVCTLCLPTLSMLENLYVYSVPYSQPDWQGNIESTEWLALLHLFTTVKNLHISEEFSCIVSVLHELIGSRTTEVLPALQNIFVEGLQPAGYIHWQEDIWRFVAARRLSGHTTTVSHWERDPWREGDLS